MEDQVQSNIKNNKVENDVDEYIKCKKNYNSSIVEIKKLKNIINDITIEKDKNLKEL